MNRVLTVPNEEMNQKQNKRRIEKIKQKLNSYECRLLCSFKDAREKQVPKQQM